MKKVLSILLIAGISSLVACGPSAEEKAAAEKRTQDSIAAVQKAVQDSLNAVAAAEKAKADAEATAAQVKADSLAKVAENVKNKPVPKAKKPAAQVIKPGQALPGRPGAVKK